MKLDLEVLSMQSGRDDPSEISIGAGVFYRIRLKLTCGVQSKLTFIFVS